MKFKLIVLLVVFASFRFAATAQENVAKDIVEIRSQIEILFVAMKSGDTSRLRSIFHDEVSFKSVVTKKGEVVLQSESLNELMNGIGTPRETQWNEVLTSWNFQLSLPMATVSTDYEFFVGDTYSHCGVNVFQLLKTNSGWKIFAITDTRKKECYLSSKEFGSANKAKIFERDIHQALEYWHKYAASGDITSFFKFMSDDFIYLGTDKTERWDKSTFYTFCEPHFKRPGGAWNFKASNRKIYFTKDYSYAWFEESLDTWMGVCRGSGVLEFIGDSWKIKHYNLCVTIDNDKIQQFINISK